MSSSKNRTLPANDNGGKTTFNDYSRTHADGTFISADGTASAFF